jgi:hypothetical protein
MALVVLGAGCTSSSPSTNGQPTGFGFTAQALCALVTQADMSAAVGTSVGAGVPDGVNAPSCTWQSSDSKVGATIAAADPSSVGQIPFGLQGISGAHVTAVSNVGDAAFFASGASNVGPDAELDIKKGGRAITITEGSTSNPNSQSVQEAVELTIGTAAAKNM